MFADIVRWVLTNMTLVLFILSMICAACFGQANPWPRRYLSWLLFMAIGIDGVWAGIFHIAFPQIASSQIGWQTSPFETETGVADFAMGVVAITSFWSSLQFQSAIALYAILFYTGVTFGHFAQAFRHEDYATDNFGIMLLLTIIRVIALCGLLLTIWRSDKKLL